jgi:two-component system nitrogen regulation sensor histidine kinase NtrY
VDAGNARDEVAGLARAFNSMVLEVKECRDRIVYLEKISGWQDVARRLAHEIKNPLTPIQLAVEECHSKYGGEDGKMQKLLDTTLEIVTEEVGTLRRLVSEFSDFARLPPARLAEADLETLLGEVQLTLERLGLGTEPGDLMLTPSGGQAIPVRVSVEPTVERSKAGGAPVLVAVDRQMLRKALDNLARNAVQAIRASGKGFRVLIHATQLEDKRVAIDVDDDGPGVPEDARARIFDPYFTTRTEGTGLGLAIVKKIVVEHGGAISCDAAPIGGARFRIVLPPIESAESRAAVEASQRNVIERKPEN